MQWCVVSAPLILGLDITQYALVEAVADIITNQDAIAVNQAWHGHPGALVWSGLSPGMGYPAARACDLANGGLNQKGWSMKPALSSDAASAGAAGAGGQVSVVAPGGGCLAAQGAGFAGGAGGLVIAECNATSPRQMWKYDPQTLQLSQFPRGHCVDVHSGGE